MTTPSAGNGERPFRLELSGVIASSLRRLQRRASRQGRGEAFVRAVREVADRLQTQPAQFGEPLYRLPTLRMQVRQGAIDPFALTFAWCEDRPVVFIKTVWLLGEP